MEKKKYEKPIVEKIEFDYTEQIVASSDCNRDYDNHHRHDHHCDDYHHGYFVR